MGDPHDRSDAPATGASPRDPKERRGRRRVDTRDPRRSRERALKILFQADVRGDDPAALLAAIVDDPRAWAMLDDLDPDEAADLAPGVDAADATADAEPHLVAEEARRRKALALDGFTRSLVQGVADHREELDDLIQVYARRWTVARMPAIDRNLLRLGTYELTHEVTSPAVVINEVIELAKRLSTEDSGRYVNGVLEAIRKHLAAARVTEPDGAVTPAIEPVVADAAEPPPFEPQAEIVDDVLPPPDDEGDAVDLVGAEVDPDADVVDADVSDEDAPDAPEDEDEPVGEPEGQPGAGQQQLF